MKLRKDVVLTAEPEASDGFPRSRVVVARRATPLVVEGRDLEAAVDLGGSTLLFVAYGDPYEESLSVVLVSTAWSPLDSATLGASGASGRLRDLALRPPDEVRFTFFADRPWTVRVHGTPRLANPLGRLAPGLSRPLRFRSWFSIGPA